MTTLYPVAGCHIYIGGVLSDKSTDFVASDFNGQSWTEIDGWSQMGAHGDTAALITSQLINRARDIKQKGTATPAQHAERVRRDQDRCGSTRPDRRRGAGSTRTSYAIRIDYNDKPSGDHHPTKHYFVALVMSAEAAGGAANTIRNLNSTFEINSNIVEVAAA
jgi:hypothetical protein